MLQSDVTQSGVWMRRERSNQRTESVVSRTCGSWSVSENCLLSLRNLADNTVGTLQHGRYHSKRLALRIKGVLEGVAAEPYLE